MPPRLVKPAWQSAPEYTHTLGPEVADLCELAGYIPDLEQRLALDLIFALDRKGKSAAFEFCVVCARQNMKTGVFKQAALGWLFITKQNLITWSAHEFSTTKEAMRDLVNLIDGCSYLSRRMKTARWSNDDPSIELMSGQRIKFKARTKTGGRGLTGDKIVLDEAFALTADHLGALMPTLSVRPDPQLCYGSSAGLADSEVLRGIRDRGRDAISARLAYLEWGTVRGSCKDPQCSHEYGKVTGCLLDDRKLWKAANPLLGRTRADGTGLTVEYVQAEREALPPQEFARERLGWWDDPGHVEPAFGPGFWQACHVDEGPKAPVGALALAVSIDQTRACIGGAALDGGRVHVKPLQSGPGTGWTVDACKEFQDTHDVDVVVDGRGPAASLIPLLERAEVRLRIADTGDILDACAGLYDQVREKVAAHCSYDELETAVAGAVQRPVGDRWAWGRRKSTTDISPLEAVTLAAWGAQQPEDALEAFAFFG